MRHHRSPNTRRSGQCFNSHSPCDVTPLCVPAVGVAIKVEPLAIGWAKLQELVRHIDHFRASGKFAVAYMELGGEKEYYLASACSEVILPPSANLSLRGLSVSGTFLR